MFYFYVFSRTRRLPRRLPRWPPLLGSPKACQTCLVRGGRRIPWIHSCGGQTTPSHGLPPVGQNYLRAHRAPNTGTTKPLTNALRLRTNRKCEVDDTSPSLPPPSPHLSLSISCGLHTHGLFYKQGCTHTHPLTYRHVNISYPEIQETRKQCRSTKQSDHAILMHYPQHADKCRKRPAPHVNKAAH